MLQFYQSEQTEKEDLDLTNRILFSSETNLNTMLDSYYMESAFIEFYYKTNGNHREIIQLLSQFN